jgi:hypothetical protein
VTAEPSWFRAVGPGLFALALALRILGIGWGLPSEQRHWSLHPDEPVVLAAASRLEPWAGKLDPGFYNYGTLPLTLFRLASAGAGGEGWEGQRGMLLAARFVSALAGAGVAWLVLATLRRRTHWIGALLGGLAAGFAPGLVVHSAFATADVVGAFFVMLAVWLAAEAGWPTKEREPPARFRLAVLAGAAAGLAAATKYSGGLAGVCALVACAQLASDRRVLAAGGAVLASLVAFVAGVPGVLLNQAAFRRDFLYEMQHVATGHGTVFAGTAPAPAYQAGNLAIALGPLGVLLGLAGLAWAVRSRAGWVWGPALFAVLSFLLIARAEVKFLRYALPLVPVLALGLGYLAGRAHEKGTAWWRLAVVAVVLAVGGFPSGGLAGALVAARAMAGPDPRDAAGAYLRGLPAGTTVFLPSDPWFWSPSVTPGMAAPRWVPREARWAEAQAGDRPKVLLSGTPWDAGVLSGPGAPGYVAFSSFENEGEARLAAQGVRDARNQAYLEFIAALEERYERDRAFPPGGVVPRQFSAVHDMMYVRPVVWVWKRKADSATTSSTTSTP